MAWCGAKGDHIPDKDCEIQADLKLGIIFRLSLLRIVQIRSGVL